VIVTERALLVDATSDCGEKLGKNDKGMAKGWSRALAKGWYRQAGGGSGGGQMTRKTNNKVQSGDYSGDSQGMTLSRE